MYFLLLFPDWKQDPVRQARQFDDEVIFVTDHVIVNVTKNTSMHILIFFFCGTCWLFGRSGPGAGIAGGANRIFYFLGWM